MAAAMRWLRCGALWPGRGRETLGPMALGIQAGRIAASEPLFVVRLEKQQGLSLPEIGEKLRKHPATGSEAEPGLLAVHIERLKERQEEVAGQLLAARALLMASQGEEPSLAGELTEIEIDAQVVETLR